MTLEGLNAIIGAILPPFIQVVNQKVESSVSRYIIATVVCLIIGTVTTAISGQLNLTDVLVSAGIIIASAQTTYATFWNNVSSAKKLMAGK